VADRLFGLETEYAFTALNSRGARVDREESSVRLLQLAKIIFPHLPDVGSNGMFLANGARFYLDHGCHPEMSTPECATPWELVRYLLAGDNIISRLGTELEASERKINQALFLKCNVDYSKPRSTWGCHESYLHRVDPAELPRQILPHLVSRLIYTGAGGFSSISQGLEFTLSPRVNHLVTEISNESTHNRGIFHTKDESLSSRGYHRLHVLCGESLASQLAVWLKVGATALVVAMIEAGLRPGESLQLAEPLEAMRHFARDTECRAEVPGKDAPPLTAIGIQRHYLDIAESHVHDSFMPAWAADVCREWRRVLDLLEAGSSALETVLDWQIKLALFKSRVARHGLTWEACEQWTSLLNALTGVVLRDAADDDSDPGEEPIAARKSRIGDQVKRLAPAIKARGLSIADLARFLTLRQELFEIDTRFGQLGDGGIFAALDHAGVLNHHVQGVEDIDAAVLSAPFTSRARLRGEWIRRLAPSQGQHLCDWQGIRDHEKKRVLDLSDPFETEERWKPLETDENNSTARGEDRSFLLRQRMSEIRERLRTS
jgi:proteasome accessory factor A